MFRKIFIIAMFATAAGYCFAAEKPLIPQIITSEVFYDDDIDVVEDNYVQETNYQEVQQQPVQEIVQPVDVPAWPIAGSDADVTLSCDMGVCPEPEEAEMGNIKIVSKIGADLVVENNFNLGARMGKGWSGGANMLHGNQIPVGFDDECARGSEMPLLHREVLEDDGGNILTVSRSSRRNCVNRYADKYDAYLANLGKIERTRTGGVVTGGGVISNKGISDVVPDDTVLVDVNNANAMQKFDTMQSVDSVAEISEFSVETPYVEPSADAEPSKGVKDSVRSWVVARGQTLREVLQTWCDKEGWDLVWTTSREYPIEASAVFKGRFVDVASAVVRNFGRAIPAPYAKFYKGNRVLVISASEE